MAKCTNQECGNLVAEWLTNGQLSEAEIVQAKKHIRNCPACSQRAMNHRLVSKALKGLSDDEWKRLEEIANRKT